jgi:hypothetical protein
MINRICTRQTRQSKQSSEAEEQLKHVNAEVTIEFGRSVALYYRSSSFHQIYCETRYLFFGNVNATEP